MEFGAHVDHAAGARAEARSATPASFDVVYARWFDEVVRWARALGGPEGDLQDVAQEVFLVVRRKLDRFDGRNLPAWLYAITARVTSDHRRRAWWRRIFRRGDVRLENLASAAPGPVEAMERRQVRALVARILDGMTEKRRATFVLFEIEGYTGEEIAAVQQVPLKTVWTRLHHARKQFFARIAAEQKEEA